MLEALLVVVKLLLIGHPYRLGIAVFFCWTGMFQPPILVALASASDGSIHDTLLYSWDEPIDWFHAFSLSHLHFSILPRRPYLGKADFSKYGNKNFCRDSLDEFY
jgi:hypothetical protein